MEYVYMGITGLLAGIIGGLLGVGGSMIMIPAMVWILGVVYRGQEGMHQYQAAAMIVNFLLVIPSVLVHGRARMVWTGVLRWLAPAALAGIALGVLLSYLPQLSGRNAVYMRYLMAGFFAFEGLHNVRRIVRPAKREGLERGVVEGYPWWRKSSVGLPVGLFAGLLGVGGGILAVPAQQMILRMPLRSAIGTSAATIMCISWFGALLKNVQLGENGSWHVSLILAGMLTPTALIGSFLGGHLTHRLPLPLVRTAFAVFLLVSAVKMFVG